MLLRSGLQGNKGHAGDNPAYPLERPRREARQTEKSRGGEVEMTPVPTPNRPIQRPLSSVQTARRTGIAKAIILPRQDDFLPNLTAFGGLLFGSTPTLPPANPLSFAPDS
jgi:hypothetical protein